MKSCMHNILILYLLAIPLKDSKGDTDIWSSNGPYDARIMTIAIHPGNNMILYVGTVMNGIYKSENGGETWIHLNDANGVLEKTMRKIRIHPLGPDTIYASTIDGIYKSSDAGSSWVKLPLPNPDNTYEALTINPEYPNIIYAGEWFGGYVSDDGGNTWQPLNAHSGSVYAIEVDPVNNNIVYLGIGTTSPGNSIYKSVDYGSTWHNVHNNIDSIGFPEAISVSPFNTDLIYYARHDLNGESGKCVYKSTNGGESWEDITPSGLIRLWAFDVLASPLEENTVYLCTQSNGAFRSRDAGGSWEAINYGRQNLKLKTITMDTSNGILYLGTYNDGIWRSSDDGDSWEKISEGIRQAVCRYMAVNWRNTDTVYVTTHNGLYISADGAASWQQIAFPEVDDPFSDFVAVDPFDASIVYLSYYPGWQNGEGGIYRTLDGGTNWQVFTEGLPDNTFLGKVAVANHGNGFRRVYMITGNGLYYSDDLAETWARVSYNFPPLWNKALAVSPINPALLFVGAEPARLFRSTDSGVTWDELSGFPLCDHVAEITCDPEDTNILYISLDFNIGLFKSIDGGSTWEDINNNLPRPNPEEHYYYTTGLAINPFNHDNLFVCPGYSGIYQSHNGGGYWEPSTDGLDVGFYAGTVIIDPSDTTRLYLATAGHSVWELTRTPSGIDDDDQMLPSHIALTAYPNPFNAGANISFSLPQASNVTLDIFDLLGRHTANLLDSYLPEGNHSLLWHPDDLAAGIYIYRITTGYYQQSEKMTLLK